MEEIQTVYNNEEDETIKPKIKLNETTVNLAPDLNIKTQNIENNDNVKENNQISNDSEQFLFPDNTLNGNVKKFAMDDFTFEEKFHTFKNYGYSLDPTNMEKSKFIGDEKQFSDFGGSTVFRENPLKRKKYRRPKREKTGDP
ncbi:pre-mRNA-processing factor 17, partial [Bonamia ostreae]